MTRPADAARRSIAGRRLAWLGVVAAVLLLHGAVTHELAARMGEFDPSRAMPQRIAVSYTRTIEPTAPPAVAPKVVTAAPLRPKSAARAVAPAASAAEVAAVEPAASAPAEAIVAKAREDDSKASLAAATGSATADVVATAVDSAASAPSGGEPFEWPASTRVSYGLTGNYRGAVTGQAQVEWIRLDDRYQVNLDLSVGPQFAPLITRRMTSEGSIAASGLVPLRYDEDTQVVMRERRRVGVAFEPDAVVLADGQRRERLDGVQDTASQFVQLTYLFSTRPELLRVGNMVAFPLALPRAMDHYFYDVVEEETLATPFGPLQAFHLKPRGREQRPNSLSAEIWIAPELRYLPVRIRIEQDPTTFIDLMISKKPEMAAAPAVASASSGKATP